MPPEPGPKGGGEGRVFCLFRAEGGAMGHAADVAAVQAQVVQVAVAQRVEFTQRLAIDRTAGQTVTDVGNEFRDHAIAGAVAVRTTMDQIKNSHFIHSFVFRMARPGSLAFALRSFPLRC